MCIEGKEIYGCKITYDRRKSRGDASYLTLGGEFYLIPPEI